MSQLRSLALGAVALLVTACVDGNREQITAPPKDTPPALKGQTNSILALVGDEAKAEFHARNYADWVGKAHNAAIAQFFAQMARGEAPRNLCTQILEFMTDAARIPAGREAGSQEDRRRAALLGMARTGCASRVAQSGAQSFDFGSVRFANWSETSSPEMQTLLDEIAAAGWTSATSGDLATTLNGILIRANQLVPTEAEIVYASASVAQSSFEDWEANLVPRTDQITVTYGPCLDAYDTPETALSTCMGIGGTLPLQTSGEGLSGRAQIRFASVASTETCNRHRGEIVASDIGGAIAGAIAGLFTGPGVFLTSLGTAATTSITTGYTYMALYAYCRLNGGASDLGPSRLQTY